MKKLFLIKGFFVITILLSIYSLCFAVTEFKVKIGEKGNNDYTTLASTESALGVDLVTAGKAITTEYDNLAGDLFTDGQTVKWDGGVSSGTILHMNSVAKSGSTTFLLEVQDASIGTLDDNDTVVSDADAGNTFDVNGTADSAQISIEIVGEWDNADITSTSFTGWTTGASNYIYVYTDSTARHNGIYTGEANSKAKAYRLVTNGSVLRTYEDYIRFEGLQLKNTPGVSDTFWSYADGELHFSHNILSYSRTGINLETPNTSGSVIIKVWNNIVYQFVLYGLLYSESADYGTLIVYNNTFHSTRGTANYEGIRLRNAAHLYLKNNIVHNDNEDDYYLNSHGNQTTAANISEDATSPDVAFRSKTVTFVTEGTDFHLGSGDTEAMSKWSNVYADGNLAVTDDIDGDARPNDATGDIGADEYVASTSIPVFMHYYKMMRKNNNG